MSVLHPSSLMKMPKPSWSAVMRKRVSKGTVPRWKMQRRVILMGEETLRIGWTFSLWGGDANREKPKERKRGFIASRSVNEIKSRYSPASGQGKLRNTYTTSSLVISVRKAVLPLYIDIFEMVFVCSTGDVKKSYMKSWAGSLSPSASPDRCQTRLFPLLQQALKMRIFGVWIDNML